MPRCQNRLIPAFGRGSPYAMFGLLINIGIVVILIMLFFVAMPYVLALGLLLLAKYFLGGYRPRRYRW